MDTSIKIHNAATGEHIGVLLREGDEWIGEVHGVRVGPYGSMRACTREMERLYARAAKKPKLTMIEGKKDMDQAKQKNTPKQIAQARTRRMSEQIGKALNKLAGFGEDIDRLLASVAISVASLTGAIEELSADAKPRRKREKKIKGEIGKAYEILEEYRRAYEPTAGGDASVCIVVGAVDEKVAVCSFLNEGKAAVRRSHLGKEIAL